MDVQTIRNQDFFDHVLSGLSQTQKRIDSKWFYDEAGSQLFEEITRLPEYYPTRTEVAILSAQSGRIANFVHANGALMELGSGASKKTRILLDALPNLAAYVPMDISQSFLMTTAEILRADYPALPISPQVADFMQPLDIPVDVADMPKTAFFPGSTLGNLDLDQARDLLARVRAVDRVDGFILGVDLVKDPETLVRAYDDAAGVTAAFNLNLLKRMNMEIAAGFDLDAFRHEARWNAAQSRIEMHLVSLKEQDVSVKDVWFHFKKGETIHTENSHKYTSAMIEELASASGWAVSEMLTDDKEWFGVFLLTPIRP